MHCIVAIAVLSLTSLLLAGCGTPLDFVNHWDSDETPVKSAASAKGDLSDGYTLQPASGGSLADHENQRRAAPLRPRPAAKPLATIQETLPQASAGELAITPLSLVGLNLDEAQRLLGPPDMQENGQPSRIWQYVDNGCQIRLHFYYDLKTRLYRLLHFEAGPIQKAGEDAQAYRDVPAHCLIAFRQRVVANGKP